MIKKTITHTTFFTIAHYVCLCDRDMFKTNKMKPSKMLQGFILPITRALKIYSC